MMPNKEAFTKWLSVKKTGFHHRQFLLLSLPLDEAMFFLEAVVADYKDSSVVSNNLCISHVKHIPLTRYQDYLGQQTNSLIFDARNGFHLNALYASAGMVQAGGIIVVLLASESSYKPNLGPLKFSYGYTPKTSYFTDVFIRHVKKNNGAYVDPTHSFFPSSAISSPLKQAIEHETQTNQQDWQLSKDQTDIETKITQRINAKASTGSVSIILGPRGRGKSTLIGHIASRLSAKVNNQNTPVVVSALKKRQLQRFYDVNTASQAPYEANRNAPLEKHAIQKNEIKFYAMDEITALAPPHSIVIIDELASIAPALLKRTISHFSHCILTGTTDGYEGSGNGFIHRVLPYLVSHKNTHVYTLSKPFRWLKGDTVETCLHSLLGYMPNMGSSTRTAHTTDKSLQSKINKDVLHDVQFEIIDKTILVKSNKLYAQIFTLLSDAHYQTTPNDIVRTLDANDCIIAIAYKNSSHINKANRQVLGVAILFEEGGELLSSLKHDISLGKRRVQGHLSPQALSLYLLDSDLCELKYLRINRIAVKHAHKRLNIGTNLLQFCEQYAHSTNVDCVSVSYGFTSSLYSFWLKNDFTMAKLGHRIDTASGTCSLLMLKPLRDIPKLSKSLLQFRLQIERQYLRETHKRLHTLYQSIYQTFKADFMFTDTVHKQFVNKALKRYLAKDINLEKIAPILLWLLTHDDAHILPISARSIQELILRYHEKGIHKPEKCEIEHVVFSAVSDIFRVYTEQDHLFDYL
jgi:tRNA(Met) cytidine acetyltransferase